MPNPSGYPHWTRIILLSFQPVHAIIYRYEIEDEKEMATVKSKKYDLTEGNILYKLLLISLPVMASQLMQMAYNLTDMFWLGRVGSDAVAASGTAGMFTWLSAGFMMLGRMGCEIGVSQSLGRGERDTAKKYAQNAAFLGLLAGVLYGLVLMVFRGGLIGFFSIQEQNVVEDAQAYLLVVGIGIPFTYLTSVIGGAFNAAGNSRMPFYLNSCGLILNIVLDPILIINLQMGVVGAAIATVTAQALVFLLHLIAIKRFKSRPFPDFRLFCKPSASMIRQIFRWATPVCIESLLFCFLSMITSRFEAGFGAYAIAVSRVGSQVESLSWLIGGGFGSALVAFVGQNFGAKRLDRIRKGFRVSMLLMLCWGAAVTAILAIFGGPLFYLFLPDESLLAYGTAYLRILAAAQIGMCVEAVVGGTFKGMGRSVPPAVVSVTVNALRVVAAYFLSLTSLGLYGIWIAIAASSLVKGAWGWIWYLISQKKQKRLPEMHEPA